MAVSLDVFYPRKFILGRGLDATKYNCNLIQLADLIFYKGVWMYTNCNIIY